MTTVSRPRTTATDIPATGPSVSALVTSESIVFRSAVRDGCWAAPAPAGTRMSSAAIRARRRINELVGILVTYEGGCWQSGWNVPPDYGGRGRGVARYT